MVDDLLDVGRIEIPVEVVEADQCHEIEAGRPAPEEVEMAPPVEIMKLVKEFLAVERMGFCFEKNPEFAGSLLVPRQRLMQEVLTAKEKLGQKKLQHLWDENREQVLMSMSPLLGRIFGVSVEVMERRLVEEIDLWI